MSSQEYLSDENNASSQDDLQLNDSSEDDGTPRCSTDAGHPRFIRKPKQEDPAKAYCSLCDRYFPATLTELDSHFKEHKDLGHKPHDTCVYCEGEVFEYKINSNSMIHHKCRHECKGSTTDLQGSNQESDLNCNENAQENQED